MLKVNPFFRFKNLPWIFKIKVYLSCIRKRQQTRLFFNHGCLVSSIVLLVLMVFIIIKHFLIQNNIRECTEPVMDKTTLVAPLCIASYRNPFSSNKYRRFFTTLYLFLFLLKNFLFFKFSGFFNFLPLLENGCYEVYSLGRQ